MATDTPDTRLAQLLADFHADVDAIEQTAREQLRTSAREQIHRVVDLPRPLPRARILGLLGAPVRRLVQRVRWKRCRTIAPARQPASDGEIIEGVFREVSPVPGKALDPDPPGSG